MTFETQVSQLQENMVALCMEYVQGKADKIYIYVCSEERGEAGTMQSTAFFFMVNNQLFTRGLVYHVIPEADPELQTPTMEGLNENLEKWYLACREFKRPMPTDIRIVYDVKQNNLSVEYQYEPIIANSFKSSNEDDWLCPRDIEERWFDEISQQYPRFEPPKDRSHEAFKKQFGDLQVDMVDICMEYVQNKADKIYIYACFEAEHIQATDCFFVINHQLVKKELVCHVIPEVYPGAYADWQTTLMNILMEDLYKLNAVCQEFDHPMPTEIKMVYDVKQDDLSVEYQYEPIMDNNICSEILEKRWFDELNQQYPCFVSPEA